MHSIKRKKNAKTKAKQKNFVMGVDSLFVVIYSRS